jgi:hypothetical protein
LLLALVVLIVNGPKVLDLATLRALARLRWGQPEPEPAPRKKRVSGAPATRRAASLGQRPQRKLPATKSNTTQKK